MRVMTRLNPTQLTLATVAHEAGVVPATLIQRFGTKRELLLAACRTWSSGIAELFAATRERYTSPLKMLFEVLVGCSSVAATPEALANGLAYLQNDITDPDFHAITLQGFVDMRSEILKLLDEALDAGEIRKCNTRQLARLIESVYNGSMLTWAIHRQGSLASWMRADLNALLAPHTSQGKKRKPRKS